MEDRHSEKNYIEGKIKKYEVFKSRQQKVLRATNTMLYFLELHCNEFTSDYVVPRTEEVSSNGDI